MNYIQDGDKRLQDAALQDARLQELGNSPTYTLYTPFGDVQDANEMRTVEDAIRSVR